MRDVEAAYRRIMSRTMPAGEAGCVVCMYSIGSHGYCQAWDGETVVLAHRIVWEHEHGPIPAGMTIDHDLSVCTTKRCVNVAHLRLLTNLENARRNGTTWPLGTCHNGHGPEHWHPKSATNMKGYCRECRNEIQRRRRARASKRRFQSD